MLTFYFPLLDCSERFLVRTSWLQKWIGPFRVLERIGAVAYKLELAVTMKVHDVFQVSLLKPYHRDGRVELPPPPELIDDEPGWGDCILEHRLVKRGRKNKVEYLINFVGCGPEHNLCADSVADYWALKPESERLVVMLSSRFTS